MRNATLNLLHLSCPCWLYRNAKEIGLNAEHNKIKQPTLEALMRQNLPVTGRNLELPKDANILSTTSPQSHITYVNPDFIKISGFTEEELLGQP
ncbi:hypothetical protein RI537_20750, partial [Aeromonas salmonicida]